MKIIDLLNKIANGEEVPKKIKYNNKIYTYEDFELGKGNDVVKFEIKKGYRTTINDTYVYLAIRDYDLDDEVEILETTITYKPDKIEKIDITNDTMIAFDDKYQDIYIGGCTPTQIAFAIKINEIIEVLNERQD